MRVAASISTQCSSELAIYAQACQRSPAYPSKAHSEYFTNKELNKRRDANYHRSSCCVDVLNNHKMDKTCLAHPWEWPLKRRIWRDDANFFSLPLSGTSQIKPMQICCAIAIPYPKSLPFHGFNERNSWPWDFFALHWLVYDWLGLRD